MVSLIWTHVFGIFVVSLIPSHAIAGLGCLNLKSPIGGWAYGIPYQACTSLLKKKMKYKVWHQTQNKFKSHGYRQKRLSLISYLFVADFNVTPRIFPLFVWTTRSLGITAWLHEVNTTK